MATVATSTNAAPFDYPSHSAVALDVSTGSTGGYLYCFGRTSTSNQFALWRSTNSGSSWAVAATFTRANVFEWSTLHADRNGMVHIAYRVSESSFDKLYYRRYLTTTGAWDSELQVSADDPNGGVNGSVWQGVDLTVMRTHTGNYRIAIAGARAMGGQWGVLLSGVRIDDGGDGTPTYNYNFFTGSRQWLSNTSTPSHWTPVIEHEHIGDGNTTGASPALWIIWGRTFLYQVKMSWNGDGWTGPSSAVLIASLITAVEGAPSGRWDGSRWLMGAVSSVDTSRVNIYERNSANTSTTLRQTPQHPNGAIRSYCHTYDNSSGNIRVYAVGTSNATLYHIEYNRTAGTWGSWTQLSANAILGTTPNQFSVRRGGTYRNSKYDVGWISASPTPNTVTHTAQAVAVAPSTPTWDTSAQPYINGGAADVNASLTLDWNFIDADSSDTQSAYALRRQIGAGSFSYWNAGSSTWGASEVFNSSGTTAVTLSSGWGAGSDANHQYWVRTRDSTVLDSSYGSSLTLIPSVKANPTITSPTAAAVLTANNVTVTWTVSEQTAYRVVLKQTSPSAFTHHDSGWITGTATSYAIPATMPDVTGWTIELTTRNNEGLASTTITRSFTVDYIEPMTPTLVVTPSTSNGRIDVAITNPAPSGGAPSFSYQDLYRRKVGETTGVRIAVGLTSGVTFQDGRAAARTAYEYQVRAYGVNGTEKVSSWTA
jgi:hypothetical protein